MFKAGGHVNHHGTVIIQRLLDHARGFVRRSDGQPLGAHRRCGHAINRRLNISHLAVPTGLGFNKAMELLHLISYFETGIPPFAMDNAQRHHEKFPRKKVENRRRHLLGLVTSRLSRRLRVEFVSVDAPPNAVK